MTKADQEALVELGKHIGQSVFATLLDGKLAISIGAMTTTITDRAYMALKQLEAEDKP